MPDQHLALQSSGGSNVDGVLWAGLVSPLIECPLGNSYLCPTTGMQWKRRHKVVSALELEMEKRKKTGAQGSTLDHLPLWGVAVGREQASSHQKRKRGVSSACAISTLLDFLPLQAT